MKVLFIQRLFFEYTGVSYLSASLKKNGFSTDLIIEKSINKIKNYISASRPDVVAMSIISGYEGFYGNTAKAIREISRDIVLVAGGPHITFFPGFLKNSEFNFGMMGEVDTLLPVALQNMESLEKVPNVVIDGQAVSCIDSLEEDLDTLPFPDRDLYLKKYPLLGNIPNKHFVTGRGCPYECSFCFNVSLKNIYRGKGRFVRRLSPERVISEIEYIRKHYPLKAVRFDDDVFTLDSRWLCEFLPLYKERINLPYSCLIRANNFSDDTGRLLKDTSCHFVQFGIESANDRLRKEVLNKKIEKKHIIDASLILKKYRIKFGTFNMLNIPTETFDQGFETIELNRFIHTSLPWCSVIQPYPGTGLAEYARSIGLLDDKGLEGIQGSYFNRGLLWNRDSKRLIRMQKLFFFLCKIKLSRRITRFLVSLPLSFVYNAVFFATFGYRYLKTYRIGLKYLIILGIKTRGDF